MESLRHLENQCMGRQHLRYSIEKIWYISAVVKAEGAKSPLKHDQTDQSRAARAPGMAFDLVAAPLPRWNRLAMAQWESQTDAYPQPLGRTQTRRLLWQWQAPSKGIRIRIFGKGVLQFTGCMEQLGLEHEVQESCAVERYGNCSG